MKYLSKLSRRMASMLFLPVLITWTFTACNLPSPEAITDGLEAPPATNTGQPGPGPGFNQPAGMVRIFETTFDNETPLAGASTKWAHNSNTSFVSGAAGAEGGAFRTLFPTGLAGGTDPTITRFWAAIRRGPPWRPSTVSCTSAFA